MVTSNTIKGCEDGVFDVGVKFESEAPIECPSCHKGIKIVFISHSTYGEASQVFIGCPLCKDTFIGEYTSEGDVYYFRKFHDYKKLRPKKEFSQEVREISKNFILIYSESEIAEEYNLNQICGVGYRKAFEFLIKDYLIFKLSLKEGDQEKEKEDIRNKSLGDCISENIEDSRIKDMAKRASWLGNDETHYIRKWEEKDLNDLKKLIEIVIHFIEIDILSKQYLEDMP